MTYGATPLREGGVQFLVWAPNLKSVAVKLSRFWRIDAGSPEAFLPNLDRKGAAVKGDPSQDISVTVMTRRGEDFEICIPDARPGDLYTLVLDGEREIGRASCRERV